MSKKVKPIKPSTRAIILLPSADGSHVNVHYALVTSQSRSSNGGDEDVETTGKFTMTTGTPDYGHKLTGLVRKLPLFAAFLSDTSPTTDADAAYYKAHATVNLLGNVKPE